MKKLTGEKEMASSVCFEGTELVKKLRQLMVRLEPHIRDAGSFEQAEKTLLHLEEYDENFHRFEFVKQLKKQVDSVLGPLIEDAIEKHSSEIYVNTNGENTLVGTISDQIINSKLCVELMQRLKKNITDAVEELQKNFDAEFGISKQSNNGPLGLGKVDEYSDEEESYATSFNQGSLIFMSYEQLQHWSENLSRTKDITLRRETMQHLNQVPTADVIGGDHWYLMRKNLVHVLNDPDEQLTVQSLKFLSRGFCTVVSQTSEIYTLLVESLIQQFQSKKNNIPLLKDGLNSVQPDCVKLLKMFCLMNEFQQEVPNYWVRFSEKFLEGILDSTLNLFCSYHEVKPFDKTSQMTPLHFTALLDCKANWFAKWMHGNYSREPLLKMFEKHTFLVNDAVRCVMEFVGKRKCIFEMDSCMPDTSNVFMGESRSTGKCYTGEELEYAYFIHSVRLLGRLITFKSGRKMFPVHLLDKEVSVSITQLLISLSYLIVDPVQNQVSRHQASTICDPGSLATDIMKNLCSKEEICDICLCKDAVTSTLLSPVSKWLDSESNCQVRETVLQQVADIFCMIASTAAGRKHLLYGEEKELTAKSQPSAAHLIAELTKKSLKGKQSGKQNPSLSLDVVGAFLYICRQLYNTCEGLHFLYNYNLHEYAAETWRQVCLEAEKTATPIPSDGRQHEDSFLVWKDACKVLSWHDTLQDNLLNFASTAKGILLLQQTGAMTECVSYMYTRYAKKLQVSKCEKFGYGYMVTQVAATAAGMVALQSAGFVQALLTELWSFLECGQSDIPPLTPKSWPVDALDRNCYKQLIRLANILSAFPAVYEMLAGCRLPSKESYSFREVPDTVVDLIDRLIILDSSAKIHSLFNYEESHVFGLRVLSILISCLDSYLLLQAQYKFQDVLLANQKENMLENSDTVIIDMLSVERNYILVKSFVIGGPTERVIPPRSLRKDNNDLYPYPLFSVYPVPRLYAPTQNKGAVRQDGALSKLLSGSKMTKRDAIWLSDVQTTLHKTLKSEPGVLRGNMVQSLLEQTMYVLVETSQDVVFSLSEDVDTQAEIKKVHLTPVQILGIEVTLRYGLHLKILTGVYDAEEKLTYLLKQCQLFLQHQQRKNCKESNLRWVKENYPSFDWFAATTFLIFSGNREKSWEFLQTFSALAASGYLWPARLHSSVHLPKAQVLSGIPRLFSTTAHYVEFVLQKELPLLASAFRMSGFTPAQICQHWLQQCFWNYLDWPDISYYVCVCLIFGIDYQVYFCIAIFKHLQRDIMLHTQQQDLIIFLKEEPICGFNIGEHLQYMKELKMRYHKTLSPDMLDVSKA